MIYLQAIALIFFLFLLVKTTDFLVSVLDVFATKTHLKKLSLTFVLIALSTSFPELAVGVSSAFQSQPLLSFGNVIGSNLANIGLVTAGSAFLVGHLKISLKEIKSLKKNLFFSFLVSFLPFVLLWDKKLGRVDGLIMISLFLWYSLTTLSGRDFRESGLFGLVSGFAKNFLSQKTLPLLAQFFLGTAVLLWAAQTTVRLSLVLASYFQIPPFFLGLFLLAVATTLPELIFQIRAGSQSKDKLVLGNLLGSMAVNASLVLGVTVFISPIVLSTRKSYFLPVLAFLLLYGLLTLFVFDKKGITRSRALVLLIVYFLFALVETMD